jgi:DNA-binding NarL/FixJ family response regulator
MAYSVVIIDDDYRIHELLSKSINKCKDLLLAGIADDFSEGKAMLAAIKPDVALIDIELPNGSGVDLIRYATEHLPHCSTMVVTIFADENLVIKCLEAGAMGYLLKGSSTADIKYQIHELLAGGSPISPPIARQLLKRFSTPPSSPPAPELSERELLVLQLSAKGYTYEEIAQVLTISRHTVSTYVKRLYKKLQAHSKTEAVFEAHNRGLV